MVKGGSLLIRRRFVGQRLRSQLLKIEKKIDTFFVSARYLKNEHQRCESRVANMWMDNVNLTFDLQTSKSIGFLLSPSGMCVPSFI
jgi:hypothetical protein